MATTKVVYAYHHHDPSPTGLPSAHQVRGTKNINFFHNQPESTLSTDVDASFVTMKNLSVPVGDFLFCRAFSFNNFKHIADFPSTKQHIVRIEPAIFPSENLRLVHHILLYECDAGSLTEEDFQFQGFCHGAYLLTFFLPPFLRSFPLFLSFFVSPTPFFSPVALFVVEMSSRLQDCRFQNAKPFGSWAVGGKAFELPKEAGFPMGSDGITVALLVCRLHSSSLLSTSHTNSACSVAGDALQQCSRSRNDR
jgi:hypothetical protein